MAFPGLTKFSKTGIIILN